MEAGFWVGLHPSSMDGFAAHVVSEGTAAQYNGSAIVAQSMTRVRPYIVPYLRPLIAGVALGNSDHLRQHELSFRASWVPTGARSR
jgi:hypothetical protein